MQSNADPDTVMREISAVFERYEAALRRHDVESLNGFFLCSADTVRFGLDEQNYGIEAIIAYRRAAQPVHPERQVVRSVVSCFGADVACVSAEFTDPSSVHVGRQTQTWVRTVEGWRIAVAHVSLAGHDNTRG
jgi:hypothetical protein